MGSSRPSRRARRRDARHGHLNTRAVTLRALADVPGDVHLGRDLVREYVVATAEEQAGPDQPADLARLLRYIPDWDDFAGRFLRSGGAFLVAHVDDSLAGCVGLTPLDERMCEMNRLWVRPPFRARGLGRRLAQASMHQARRLGYARMLLDVMPQRTGAIALYRSLGFVDVPPMHEYAFPMVFLGRDL
jgi:ribosomal protein S18 acetylase RimI-like enzyme